ncbi:Uu.00g072460.m01.CDS01 [Anthostomella pinea]|uniref:Uu.00g072460.m01.CDS01 n=1 Tax=Anthostomella pinea TaxID=933095 RepID=A0AAI8VPF8_9PEZI|nr:Uu.00g072460.m01.CDS01 [Anthostomella pinea]
MPFSYGNQGNGEYGWRRHWGLKLKWTPEHLTPEDLEPLTQTYDTVGQDAVERLDEIAPPPYALAPPKDGNIEGGFKPDGEKRPRRDLYELVQEHASTDDKIGRFWTEINTIPEWVDWEQIERGQKIFFRYGGPAITSLTFLSLLGGMGSGRTVETLDRTGGFGVNVVRRRLLETTQHTLNVHRDLDSIKPGGDGFVNSVRVRLLHTAVRRRILHMAEQRPDYYNVAKYGAPVNDLDCIGTINTFSATVIWLGLPRQGIWLRQQEILDYLALWRYVAYLMGTPHDWMATPDSAKRMMESLLVSEIRPSKASANLANNIITGLAGQAPTFASREFLCAETYWLNGSELAKALAVERPSLYYFALVLGQNLLFMTLSYINRSFTYLDERNIKFVRRAFFKVLLHDKSIGGLGYTTKFNFKHIPEFDKMSTERGLAPADSGAVRRPGIERTALLSLLSFSALAGVVLWCGVRAVAGVVRWVWR